jgi:23S rRNA G2069 N7-methylase RlmK/C1962 C5-methylase RlmI
VQRQRRNFDAKQSANLEDARRSARARVVVARGKANMFLDGNPIVYAGAIERVEGDVRTGDWVQVSDHALSPICYGFYNETSSYSVRALSQAWERGCEDGDGVVAQRIREAYELRRDLGLVGNERTTCYRLLNSEGDKISGLNADVYGEIVVASSTAAWVEQRRDVILRAFADVLGANTKVVWRRD